jgi:type II secretory pathway component GspD/PulD (secretin)
MTLPRILLLALAISPLALVANAQTADTKTETTAEPVAEVRSEPPAGTTDCSKIATRTGQVNCRAKYSQLKIVYLTNVTSINDANEILVAVRNMFDPALKVYMLSNQNAIAISSYPEELTKVEAFIHTLDRPHKTYKLTYTLAESDAGKSLGIEHFSIIAVDGQRASFKQGDKIPVATGSFSTDNSASQTQFTYLDVGMNFDLTANSYSGGIVLKSKVEQSSVGPTNTIAGVAEPVVRQTVLDNVSTVPFGKPLMLGSIDVPNSTRHIDIDVAVEQLK